MSKYVSYAPDQDWLLPPRISDELGEGHLVFFIHKLVEKLGLSAFETDYCDDGRPAYPPSMMLKIWLYAYALGLTSSRRIEQRLREDLGFRFLAADLKPDFWTLNQFRRRHPRALNDVFTLVVETAREFGLGKRIRRRHCGRNALGSTNAFAAGNSAARAKIKRSTKTRASS